MNNLSLEMIAIISFLLVFIAILSGMIFQAIRAGDRKSRFTIIARILGVAALFIGFLVVWFTSKKG